MLLFGPQPLHLCVEDIYQQQYCIELEFLYVVIVSIFLFFIFGVWLKQKLDAYLEIAKVK